LLISVSSFNLRLRIGFALTANQKVTGWGVTIDVSLIFEEYLLNYNASLAAADVEVTGAIAGNWTFIATDGTVRISEN
jgi:hypothetical protein